VYPSFIKRGEGRLPRMKIICISNSERLKNKGGIKMKGRKGIRVLSIMIAVILLSLSIMKADAHAAIPERINYQGYLTDSGGTPVNTPKNMTFKIYTVASGGTALWTETQSNVPVNNGIYNVVLGSVASMGSLTFDVPYFLGVTVGTDSEMTPRQPLTSVAYALTADTALNVANNVVTSTMIQNGAVLSEDVNFNYAGSTSKGGPATDLVCTGCVSQSELNFAPLLTETDPQVGTLTPNLWCVSNSGGTAINCTQTSPAANAWSLIGNAGTTPGTNFIGTTDNKALEVKVNNTRALRIEPNATSPNVIGGYSGNLILSGVVGASVSGGGESGFENKITDDFGTIGGGTLNVSGSNDGFSNNSLYTTIGGGNSNTASGGISTVSGGQLNTASGLAATVGGGYSNVANSFASTVNGGSINTVNGDYSTIGGGLRNFTNAKYATISGGGIRNPADVTTRNRVTDDYGTIGGGADNQAGNNAGTTDDAISATVGGGWSNQASGYAATVGGGESNQASGYAATVGGGISNQALVYYASVGGGQSNTASGYTATVGGGGSNFAIGEKATVSGGSANQAHGMSSAIGGGYGNHADNEDAVVGGGFENTANGPRSTVGGGFQNQATNNAATVPGGANNLASGGYSFAAGAQALATHTGSFVWSSAEGTSSFGDNTFAVRAHGGVRFYTASGTGAGCFIAPGGSDCAGGSDRNIKENYADVDSKEILETLMTLPIQTWNYKSQSPTVRHIGPVAQDFNGMFAYLFNEVESPVHVNKMDEIGISLSAIQGLYQLLKEKDIRISELESQVATLGHRLSTVEALITGGR
jgi:hypothetical protein